MFFSPFREFLSSVLDAAFAGMPGSLLLAHEVRRGDVIEISTGFGEGDRVLSCLGRILSASRE